MAITSLDNAIAGMKPAEYFTKSLSGALAIGRPFNPHYLTGIPGAAVANTTAGLSGAALTSWPGQIPIPAASFNTHLARFSGVSSASGGVLTLCDRLWHGVPVNTSTGLQTINSVTWPARDADGATNGRGVYIGLEVAAAVGAGAPSITIGYTNSNGDTGRSGANTMSISASAPTGTFWPIGLAAGDVGVRSIQTYQQSASMTSGTVNLVAYRVLAQVELPTTAFPNAVDVLTGGMPRLYDTTVPFLIYYPAATTTTALSGSVIYTQG